ncbi:hypothetical protein [Roseicella aerolata]|uniref:Uncharacterized protein n=1 Tax=Roseicella aerolata TaxID=2883479 RepID=A0A9X1IHI2_9PROT|nr:hypothetical protein [Roseicella aerolata]MCB4823175.1 hypothetical protein [Roseicella aerolata]
MAQRERVLFIADRFDAPARQSLSMHAALSRPWHGQRGGKAVVVKETLQTIYVAALVAFATWGFLG